MAFNLSSLNIEVNIHGLSTREADILREALRAAAQSALDALIRDRTPTAAPDRQAVFPMEAPDFAERIRKRREAEREANQIARQLLLECLSEKQRLSYQLFNSFTVKTRGLFGRKYRLAFKDRVELLNRNGTSAKRYCVQLNRYGEDLPEYDRLLAAKMMLETDEKLFLKIAIPVHAGIE